MQTTNLPSTAMAVFAALAIAAAAIGFGVFHDSSSLDPKTRSVDPLSTAAGQWSDDLVGQGERRDEGDVDARALGSSGGAMVRSSAPSSVGEPNAESPDTWGRMTLVGEVVGPDGGPAVGAEVTFGIHAPAQLVCVTDERGGFRVELPYAADTGSAVRAITYWVQARLGELRSLPTPWIEAREGETLHLPSIHLRPMVVVSGHVVDVDGQPVSGACVVDAWSGEPVAESDASGRFTIIVPRRNGGLTLVASATGLTAIRGADPIPLNGVEPDPHVELVLQPSVAIEGSVVDTGGVVVAGVEVASIATPMALDSTNLAFLSQPVGTAVTDEQGRFVVDAPVDGRFLLAIDSAAGRSKVVFESRPTEPVILTVVPYLAGGTEVTLRLTDASTGAAIDSTPVLRTLHDEVIVSREQPMRTPADGLPSGTFSHRMWRRAGSFRILVSVAGYAPKWTSPFLCGEAPVELDLALETGFTVRGVVRDAVTGAPLPSARVSVDDRGGEEPFEVVSTDRLGTFLFTSLWPGRRVFRVVTRTHAPFASDPIELTGDPRVIDVAFDVDPGGVIEGRVTRADGRPAPGTTVVVSHWLEQDPRHSFADADVEGRYRVSGVTPGRVQVEVGVGDSTHRKWVEVLSGRVTPCDVRLNPELLTVIEGKVLRGEDPFADVEVTLASGMGYAHVNAAGAFTFPAIPPGEYEVAVNHEEAGVLLRELLVVEPVGTQHIELRLGVASLSVVVDSHTDDPPALYEITLYRMLGSPGDDAGLRRDRTNLGVRDGETLLIKDLKAGWYFVDAETAIGRTHVVAPQVVQLTDRSQSVRLDAYPPARVIVVVPDSVVELVEELTLSCVGREIEPRRLAAEGTVEFRDLPPGDYVLRALAPPPEMQPDEESNRRLGEWPLSLAPRQVVEMALPRIRSD